MKNLEGDITTIYENLPNLRREVLDRILVGFSIKQIAQELFHDKKDSVACVTAHLKEIYRNYKELFKDADPESKRSHLIILFYSQAPSLVAKLTITIGSPLSVSTQAKLFGDLSGEYRYELHPIEKEEIPMLQGMGRKYFSAQDHLPTKLLESWYSRDPNSFRKMLNKNGRPVGFFIILFPKLDFFREFSSGNIIERNLKAINLISSGQRQQSQENYLYVSVVVGEHGGLVTNICILLCLAKYIDCIREYRKVNKLYATAATEAGRDLMRDNFGFRLYTPAVERKDGEDFFESDLTEIQTTLFDYLAEKFPAFKKYSSSIDFSNENQWRAVYPNWDHPTVKS
jgi:hypothetical protein